jgi:hypothetical protein
MSAVKVELSAPLSTPDYWFFVTLDKRQKGFKAKFFFDARSQAAIFFGVSVDDLRLYHSPFMKDQNHG